MANKILKTISIPLFGLFAGQVIASPVDIIYKVALLLSPNAGILLMLNPLWGFMILLFVRPLGEYIDFSPTESLNVLNVHSMLIILLSFYVLITVRNIKWFPENLKWFYIYLLIAILSTMNSFDMQTSAKGIIKLVALLSLFLLGYNLPNSVKDAVNIIRAIALAAVIPIVYGLYQAITGRTQYEYVNRLEFGALAGTKRINSVFSLHNEFAIFIGLMALVAVLGYFYSKSRKEKTFSLLVLSGSLVCLFFTFARTGWIATALPLFFIGIYEKRIRKWLIIFALVLLPLSWNTISARFDDLATPYYGTGGFNSLEFRIDIARQLVTKAVPEHFFFGFGPNLALLVATRYTTYDFVPHNDYIRVLVESGIIGLIVYLIFWGKMFFYLSGLIRRGVNRSVNFIFLGILIYYLVFSSSDNLFPYVSGAGYIFCLMGLAQKINEFNEDTVSSHIPLQRQTV